MIHNGIEYGDMQLIAEAYDVMRSALGMPAEEIARSSPDWNTRKLASYLIEVTADVLRYIDTETGQPLVDLILDAAEQKGTGRWTIESALDLASPVPTIDAAVTARNLSALRGLRVQASEVLLGPSVTGGPGELLPCSAVPTALTEPHRARGCPLLLEGLFLRSGMALLNAASATYNWNLDLSEIARIWTGGCIIRAAFLADIMRAYRDNPDLANLLLDPQIAQQSDETVGGVRRAIVAARSWGIPCRERRRRSITSTPCASRSSRQSHPGATRLFRRAHLPAQRSRGHLPHPLARRRATRGAGPLASRHRRGSRAGAGGDRFPTCNEP